MESHALALQVGCWVDQERGAPPETVQPRLEQALALAVQGNALRAQALVTRLLAAHHAYHLADPATAEPLFQSSIRLFAKVGDSTQISFRQTELAWCWAQLGREHAAQALLNDVARAHAANPTAPIMIYALTVLGQLQLRLHEPRAAALALQQAAQMALHNDWLGLLPLAWLHLPLAWLGCGQAQPAALLHGYMLASWPQTVGRFNRVQRRINRRTSLLLTRSLGSQRRAELLHQGGKQLASEALELVRGTSALLAASVAPGSTDCPQRAAH